MAIFQLAVLLRTPSSLCPILVVVQSSTPKTRKHGTILLTLFCVCFAGWSCQPGLLLKHPHLAHKRTNIRQLTFEDLLMVFGNINRLPLTAFVGGSVFFFHPTVLAKIWRLVGCWKRCFLIAKIIRWNKSFQNMYDMLQTKVDRLAGKTYFVNKKTPKIMDNFFGKADFGGCWRPNQWHQVNF